MSRARGRPGLGRCDDGPECGRPSILRERKHEDRGSGYARKSSLSRVEDRAWPLSVEAPGTPEPAWVVPACWFFVALGIVIRLVRYLVDYPIWHDEAFLAANFWDRDYVDLLLPLEYGQVAPWLFLAIERTAVTWLGYSELVAPPVPDGLQHPLPSRSSATSPAD